MRKFEQYCTRGKQQHGAKFSAASLAPQFIAAYNSGERITVEFVDNDNHVYEVRRGTIGATTGWQPCFLLMGRRTDHGSSYTLGANARITTMDAWRKFKAEQAA